MAKSNLPLEVHDHFRKANVLHGYVEKNLGEATEHALETGQELLAAKKRITHGNWEFEVDRLFDGSLRTAQFYMEFAKDAASLPKAQRAALLLEGSLRAASKAAREAVRPTPKAIPAPAPQPDPFDDESPGEDDRTGTKPQESTSRPPRNGTDKPAGPKFDRSYWLKQWDHQIGPLCRLVDKIANEVGDSRCKSQTVVQDHLNIATEEMIEWMGVKK